MALAMALTRVIFSLPNMSLTSLALRNEEEPKAKRVASKAKVLLASSQWCNEGGQLPPGTDLRGAPKCLDVYYK